MNSLIYATILTVIFIGAIFLFVYFETLCRYGKQKIRKFKKPFKIKIPNLKHSHSVMIPNPNKSLKGFKNEGDYFKVYIHEY